MPVYNGQAFLGEQIESILCQDYKSLRLHIVDDGSKDESLKIARSYEARDPRVLVQQNPENLGLLATMHVLLSSVDTDYFALADQDDIWDADKLSRSVAQLRESTAELVYSDVRTCDEDGRVIKLSYLSSARIVPVTGRDPVPFVFRNPAIGHTIVSTRRVAALAARMPARLVFHEAWIVGVACTFGDVAFIDAQLGSYRVHRGNVVGPRRHSKARRLATLVRSPGGIAKRDMTRSGALYALSELDPELEPVAKLFDSIGTARLLAWPAFTRFLFRYRDHIGHSAVAAEVALFLIGGFVRESPQAIRSTKSARC